MVTRWEGVERWAKKVKRTKKYKLPVIVNNILITIYDARWVCDLSE